MSENIPPPRTAAAIKARRERTRAKVSQVRDAVAAMQHQKVPVTPAAVARRTGVSRTFLYENADARQLIATAADQNTTSPSRLAPGQQNTNEAAWRERALNAEDALKTAHNEIRTHRSRIAQLMGQIRDMESNWTADSVERIAQENADLKQRLRQANQTQHSLEERLQAARSNGRFQDRRIAQLETQLLDLGPTP